MGSFLVDTTTTDAYVLGAGPDVINIRAVGRDREDRVVYRYDIFNNGVLVTSSTDIRSGVGDQANARSGLGALVSFLLADAERFAMGDPYGNGYAFARRTVAWADDQVAELQHLDLVVNYGLDGR